jgi:hypothetical protein
MFFNYFLARRWLFNPLVHVHRGVGKHIHGWRSIFLETAEPLTTPASRISVYMLASTIANFFSPEAMLRVI